MENNNTVMAFKELGDIANYESIVSYGIVNPFGPTLYILAITRDWAERETATVALLLLHPFSPLILKKWEISTEQKMSEEFVAIIKEICTSEELGGGCPTLLISGSVFGSSTARTILAKIVASRDGGKDSFERCKKFPAKAYDRVSNEILDMFSGPANEKLSLKEAEQFVDLQTKPESLKSELKAFFTAYEGSINFARMLPVELPLDDFRRVFEAIVLA